MFFPLNWNSRAFNYSFDKTFLILWEKAPSQEEAEELRSAEEENEANSEQGLRFWICQEEEEEIEEEEIFHWPHSLFGVDSYFFVVASL